MNPALLELLAARTAAGAWTPASLSGLWGWWDASAITGLSDTAPVPSWPDMSGNGRTATQSNPSLQPTYTTAGLNGLPSVLFSSDRLPTGAALTGGDVTIFAVADPTAPLSYNTLFDGGVALTANQGDANLKLPGVSDNGRGGAYPSTASVVSVRFSDVADSGTVRVNGSATNLSKTQIPPTRNAEIGSQAGSDYWPGYISEVIAYAAALSDSDMAQVESYLTSKWSIT